jgi:hypothetical protein
MFMRLLPSNCPSNPSTCAVSPLYVQVSRCPLLKKLLCGRVGLAVRAALKLVLYICLSADSGDLERVLFLVQIFGDHVRNGGQCYRFTADEKEGCVHEVGWANAVWVCRHLSEDTRSAFCKIGLGGP